MVAVEVMLEHMHITFDRRFNRFSQSYRGIDYNSGYTDYLLKVEKNEFICQECPVEENDDDWKYKDNSDWEQDQKGIKIDEDGVKIKKDNFDLEIDEEGVRMETKDTKLKIDEDGAQIKTDS